ncbi:glucose-6-phosphate isomerase [uncultured Campylobacter sp.]|uniref:glucose-6-phosphate isomerase n=1 Tax=uncultured Campylobacter sp. TaxID=218934 RepID=UPI00263904E7|nr:glucose-6-phosphate isomerase [uncultured Campylobacter sp.]
MVKNKIYFNKEQLQLIKEYQERINSEFKSGQVGYYHLLKFDKEILKKVDEFLKNRSFDDVVVVGVGGSSLGTKAIYRALQHNYKKINLHFLDNIDGLYFEEMTKKLHYKTTLFLIISKSGTTIETITNFKLIIDKFNVDNLKDNFIIITNEGSKLEKFAISKEVLFFNAPKNISGRFSVLSVIGLIPLYIAGFDIDELLNGARECEREFFELKDLTILQKAYHYATSNSASANILFSYSEKLKEFNEWYVQLWAESLGKKRAHTRVGLTPIGLIGSKDQHSFLQLLMDGPKDKTVTFIKVSNSSSNLTVPQLSLEGLEECDFVNGTSYQEFLNLQCKATLNLLIDEGLSVDLLEVQSLDEWHMGYLIFYYELLTSCVGAMLGINTYDQPGVEVGKRILKTIFTKKHLHNV